MYVACAHIACAHITCAHPFRFPGVCCCFSEFLVGSASLRFPEVLRSLVSAATYGWEFPTVVLVPESQLNSQPRSLVGGLETASELFWCKKYWITSWCFNNAPKATSLPCYLQGGDFGWFCSWAGKGRLCFLTRPGSCCRWWQSIYSVVLTDCQSSDMVLYYLFLLYFCDLGEGKLAEILLQPSGRWSGMQVSWRSCRICIFGPSEFIPVLPGRTQGC